MQAAGTLLPRWKRALIWIAAGCATLLVSGTAVFAAQVVPGPGQPAPGLFVGRRVPPPDSSLGAWLEQRRGELAARSITLTHGMKVYRFVAGDLGVLLDIAATMDEALRPGRTGPMSSRAFDLARARDGLIDVPLRYTIDLARAEMGLAAIANEVRRDPVNARLDLTAHKRIDEIPGEVLDVRATAEAVREAMVADRDTASVVTRSIPAEVTAEALSLVDVTKVAATFETKFNTWGIGAARASNIALAARAMDGTVLLPGQKFSFNTVVGRRTRSGGYKLAPIIMGDELELGIGGGICQVASTLYAAALFSAMEIQERWAHGRPSAYTKMGLDATVSYPSKDVKLRNNLPYPVILHVFIPKKGVLRAEILGGDPVAKVTYRYGVAKIREFVRRITPKPWFKSGRSVRRQKGIRGYSVVSLVKTTYPNGRVVERSYRSEYRPTPEVYWVSPDYDETELPELPKGAKGVEGRLADGDQKTSPAG